MHRTLVCQRPCWFGSYSHAAEEPTKSPYNSLNDVRVSFIYRYATKRDINFLERGRPATPRAATQREAGAPEGSPDPRRDREGPQRLPASRDRYHQPPICSATSPRPAVEIGGDVKHLLFFQPSSMTRFPELGQTSEIHQGSRIPFGRLGRVALPTQHCIELNSGVGGVDLREAD